MRFDPSEYSTGEIEKCPPEPRFKTWFEPTVDLSNTSANSHFGDFIEELPEDARTIIKHNLLRKSVPEELAHFYHSMREYFPLKDVVRSFVIIENDMWIDVRDRQASRANTRYHEAEEAIGNRTLRAVPDPRGGWLVRPIDYVPWYALRHDLPTYKTEGGHKIIDWVENLLRAFWFHALKECRYLKPPGALVKGGASGKARSAAGKRVKKLDVAKAIRLVDAIIDRVDPNDPRDAVNCIEELLPEIEIALLGSGKGKPTVWYETRMEELDSDVAQLNEIHFSGEFPGVSNQKRLLAAYRLGAHGESKSPPWFETYSATPDDIRWVIKGFQRLSDALPVKALGADWITMTEAAKRFSAQYHHETGEYINNKASARRIETAVKNKEVTDNGKHGRERRIESQSLERFIRQSLAASADKR